MNHKLYVNSGVSSGPKNKEVKRIDTVKIIEARLKKIEDKIDKLDLIKIVKKSNDDYRNN